MSKVEIKDIMLKGRVMWAKVQEPMSNPKSRGKKTYSIDIEVDQDTVSKLRDAGVPIGTGQYDKKLKLVDGITYLAGIKRSELNSKGDPVAPLKVIDASLQSFSEMVGNGSVCKIKAALIPVEGQTIMYLKVVQVLEHVAFGGTGGDLEGFTAEKDSDLDGFESSKSDDGDDFDF